MSNEFIFISISILAITFIVVPVYFIKIKKTGKNTNSGNENNQISGDGNSITQIGTQNVYENKIEKASSKSKQELTPEEIKNRIKVLFIDDKEFPVVEHLKSIGYLGVNYIKDVKDLDDNIIRYANIIFIDINGVGLKMGFSNQGMGLCGALKRKYKDKKRIVLYSGETEGSLFDEDAKMADATLKKDSDVYQFISYITDYAKELL